MGKSLVIVESPAKAKTIHRYLGDDFIVKSSIGHIRDLPTGQSKQRAKSKGGKKEKAPLAIQDKQKRALIQKMGIDPYQGWIAHYEVLPGKEKTVAELKAIAAETNYIYLATDLDREGEAIAWHLQELIGGDQTRYRRVIFNEITQNAIQQAFAAPGVLNMARVHAQQARRFLDRIVGYMVSPLLWKKVARGLSAGRVQSVAVRLVVEREREIKAFIPQEYWLLHADLLTPQEQLLRMQVVQVAGNPFKPCSEAEIQQAMQQLEKSHCVVASREEKQTHSKPPAPFVTSTLQQAASTRLNFSVHKTMLLAQRLYEAGYVTYMRTDSTNLSLEAVQSVRNYIQEYLGTEYLPSQPQRYVSKQHVQEAHEAIRPSDVYRKVELLKGVDADAKKLYQLIWSQFVACQMVPARYHLITLTAQAGRFVLKTKGVTVEFDGWTRILPVVRKSDEERVLPPVVVDDILKLHQLDPSQHFTRPPARYSEASLVKELEKRGIGRPSTYASIISTIQARGYVKSGNRRFYAEKMGEIVTDRLQQCFQALMSYDFTARMETILDDIATQKADWKMVLDHFFSDFSQQLAVAEREQSQGGMRQNQMVLIEILCSLCKRNMGIRTAATGIFLGCSGYLLAGDARCKNTINLVPEKEVFDLLADEEAETAALRARKRCPQCTMAMDSYLIDNSSRLYVCGNNPTCSGYVLESDTECKPLCTLPCDKCGMEMQLKVGRFGKYMGCKNSACKNTRRILHNGEIAPPKEEPIPLPELKCSRSEAYFVLRDGAAGVFLAASTFPYSRESRAPWVQELVRFKERLPQKLRYLATAPETDPDGNPTVLKFNRKTKQQYVTATKNGKVTGWTAFYIDGRWVAKQK